jgi:hypothetical protein
MHLLLLLLHAHFFPHAKLVAHIILPPSIFWTSINNHNSFL